LSAEPGRRAVAIRHVAFEDLGTLGDLLPSRGFTVEYVEAGGNDFATVGDPDLLVVLGGPIGACDDSDYPFLVSEAALVARRLAARRATLGICLGAQLMARALGARVYPNPVKEIGWAPLDLTEAGRASALAGLGTTPVLHWHGDTFDLPAGATLLASTPACRHQAFAWGKAALALQFHVEVKASELENWFIGHTCEIAATPGVTVGGLRTSTAAHGRSLERAGFGCLSAWLASAGL
jgi:GMP synthase (glutamine-hydrolysing)